MFKPITIKLPREKECKGSIRYATNDKDQPVTNVYVSRSAGNDGKMPDAIEITLKAA